jgi:hypothetical protein
MWAPTGNGRDKPKVKVRAAVLTFLSELAVLCVCKREILPPLYNLAPLYKHPAASSAFRYHGNANLSKDG